MSREWYIRTDKRPPEPEIVVKPLSAKEKWRQNRKKYLFWIAEALVLIAVLAIALPSLLTKESFDYTVTLVTMRPTAEAARQELTAALAACGEDRDGDGRVTVEVRDLILGDEIEDANTQRERFITSFYSERYTLFAMESACYDRYLAPYIAADTPLFEPLPQPATGILSLDGTRWQTPDGFLFGVRKTPNADEKEQETQAAHLRLLQAYMQTAPKK